MEDNTLLTDVLQCPEKWKLRWSKSFSSKIKRLGNIMCIINKSDSVFLLLFNTYNTTLRGNMQIKILNGKTNLLKISYQDLKICSIFPRKGMFHYLAFHLCSLLCFFHQISEWSPYNENQCRLLTCLTWHFTKV